MHQRLAALAVAAVLLGPSLAFPQTTTPSSGITVRESAPPTQTPPIINIAECGGTVQDGVSFTWTVPATVFQQASGGNYQVLVSDTTGCPINTSGAVTSTIGSVAANAATASFPPSGTYSVPQLLRNVQITACVPAKTSVVNVCVNWLPATGLTPTNPVVTGSIALDLAKPNAPEGVTVTGVDEGLNVSWQQGTGAPEAGTDAGTPGIATRYKVYYVPYTGAPPASVDTSTAPKNDVTGANTLSTRVGKLTNGQDYAVVVTALTDGLNESDPSAVATGKPIAVDNFWRAYQNDGGRETGGCSSGAASLLALLALIPIAVGARRAGRSRS